MKRLLLAVWCLAAFSTSIPAQESVPPALRDWRPWALKDLEYRACPFLGNSAPEKPDDFICAWPGRLNLSATSSGATFSIHWRVEAPGWIALPGDAQHWPQQVTVNAQRLPVLDRDEAPMVWLTPGSYEIAGRIPWHEQPQTLAVPPDIGLVALSVDGKAVVPVRRDGKEVTLGRAAAQAPEADSIDLRVYRKLTDGVPAELHTQVLINVSGQAREEVLGPALPDGFAPIALNCAWPARLDGDGKLHVQVQPGTQTLLLDARATTPLQEAVAKPGAAPWPKQEVWSYEAVPHLRITAASGAVQLDPRQAEVPAEWQALPAFALADGAKLTIEQRSRGLAPDEANRLTLQREAWLDFAGDGWYARDHVSGDMAQGWRFDVATPYTLEQASARGGTDALLITRGAKPELSGVEWRTPRVELNAGVRLAGAAAMPVAGWQQTFDNVHTTLHLPFGYKLLAAPGADSASGSWMAGWTLLDIFVCAILVLLAWRLLGLTGAAVVVAYLLLGYQEYGAPLWTLIIVFAFALIARALPEGRLANAAVWLKRTALLVLILWTLPFATQQVRYALYPQLEQGGYATHGFGYPGRAAYAPQAAGELAKKMEPADMVEAESGEETRPTSVPSPAAMPAPPPPAQPMKRMSAPKSAALDTVVVTGSNIRRVDIETSNPVVKIDKANIQYAENTIVQTGGGAPNWTLGSAAWLSWSGPVIASQSVHLLIAPPWLVRTLRIVLVALLAWLLWQLVRGAARAQPPRALGAAVLVIAGIVLGGSAQAQGYPPQELLKELRDRAVEAPKCAPACASIAEAQVAANGDDVSVALEAHAGERIALPLPDDATATLKSIQVDGTAADALARGADGGLWLALGRGVHRVQLDFAAGADKFALAFPLKPAHVLFQGKGWQASGLSDEHLLTETLTLARERDTANAAPGAGVQQFPPYVRVQRDVTLGLEWTLATDVRRLSPAQGGFTVEVPVLAGEHVTSAGIKVQNGKIPAAIGDGETGAHWQSTLDKGDTLTLTAPRLSERAEVWRVVVSPAWHVEFSGVPVVGLNENDDANELRNFEFHPLPDETLTLHVTRPAAVQGASRAIDAVTLSSEAGQRASTHALGFTLRASQGGDQVVTLAKDAEVLGVTRDGQALNLRALDGKLSVPVAPGMHHYEIRFRGNDAIGTVVRTPPVSLGASAANVALGLQLPGDRWLLATWGPPVGPAVLYWGELVVMIALAYALARTQRTRLKFRDWLLLGLGFSTFSWVALLIVVAWLFAFEWRGRGSPPSKRWQFNLLQVALAALTLVALVAIASAIPHGLLGQPDMHVAGNSSTAQSLWWFSDRSADALPQASAFSVPLWVYKLLMLAWALWLANALIGWLRDGFAAWMKDGYWRMKPAVMTAPAAPPAA